MGLLGSQPRSHRRNIGTRARCVRSQLSAPLAWQQGEMSGGGMAGQQEPGPKAS